MTFFYFLLFLKNKIRIYFKRFFYIFFFEFLKLCYNYLNIMVENIKFTDDYFQITEEKKKEEDKKENDEKGENENKKENEEKKESIDQNSQTENTNPQYEINFTPNPIIENKIEISKEIIENQNELNIYTQKTINKTLTNKKMKLDNFFKKNRHFFIMTDGGKPVYSRYGDEIENSTIFATISAIITKFTIFNSTDDKKEEINIISNSKNKIVFLKKGALIFIVLSKKNDSISLLHSQLEFVFLQLMSILTNNFYQRLEDNPSRCLTAMSDTEVLFENMIKYTSHTFASLFNSFQVLNCEFREILNKICEDNLGKGRICMILTINEIISLAHHPDIKICPGDIVLIQNLISSSESLRETETWVPICLPGISNEGYLQLYCKFDILGIGICFLTENMDPKYFMEFAEQYQNINQILMKESYNEKIMECIPNKIIDEDIEIQDDELLNALIEKMEISNVKKNFNMRESIANGINKNNKSVKGNIFDDIICGLCKHRQLNQFFPIKINNNFRNITKSEKDLLKEYNVLFDKLHLYTFEKDNFFLVEKGEDYTNAIMQNENYILICSFNFFIDFDEVSMKMNNILKQIKKNENKYFIIYK